MFPPRMAPEQDQTPTKSRKKKKKMKSRFFFPGLLVKFSPSWDFHPTPHQDQPSPPVLLLDLYPNILWAVGSRSRFSSFPQSPFTHSQQISLRSSPLQTKQSQLFPSLLEVMFAGAPIIPAALPWTGSSWPRSPSECLVPDFWAPAEAFWDSSTWRSQLSPSEREIKVPKSGSGSESASPPCLGWLCCSHQGLWGMQISQMLQDFRVSPGHMGKKKME